jgi:signal transduction histidine kinase
MTDKMIITRSHQQCRLRGLDPDGLPIFTESFSAGELKAQLIKYKEAIEVIHFFMDKFLSSVQGDPMFIAILDNEGYVLDFRGDSSIKDAVRKLGIVEGVRFSEELGPNAPALCMLYEKPIQLVGEDHFHKVLHRTACYTAPFRIENNELSGTITIMTDISCAHPHLLALLSTIVDSIERELMLRTNNTQLQILNQMLLDTNYYGVIITDAHGVIIEMNVNCLEMLCADDNKNLGSSVFEMRAIGEYFERVIVYRDTCIGVELSIRFNDAIRYYMLDVVPIYDNERTLIRVVGSLRDITEMKTTEELLRNTEKLVFAGQLAVSIAHEIKNPLTTVKGMLQLSNETNTPTHYSLIMSELERMNAIVSEFIILGKPQAVHFKEEQCLTIVEEVLSIFEIQSVMNGVTINRIFEQGLTIRCDRNQIKQVFLNILKNALEALPFGGEIDVHMDVQDNFQRIRFTDNGEGMTDQVLQRIGEPFHTTKPDGNGLGMMIVQKIMASHKGHLVITSEVGAGTTVEVYLPVM